MAKLKGPGSGGKGGAAIPSRSAAAQEREALGIGPITAPHVGIGGTAASIGMGIGKVLTGGMKIGRARTLAGQRLGAWGAAWEEEGLRKVGVVGMNPETGGVRYVEFGKGRTFDEAFTDAKNRGHWKEPKK